MGQPVHDALDSINAIKLTYRCNTYIGKKKT